MKDKILSPQHQPQLFLGFSRERNINKKNGAGSYKPETQVLSARTVIACVQRCIIK